MSHNRPIYHCEFCGAVVIQDPYRLPPFCCGHEMVKAGEETLRDDLVPNSEIEPVLSTGGLAPRRTSADSEAVNV